MSVQANHQKHWPRPCGELGETCIPRFSHGDFVRCEVCGTRIDDQTPRHWIAPTTPKPQQTSQVTDEMVARAKSAYRIAMAEMQGCPEMPMTSLPDPMHAALTAALKGTMP